MVTEEQWAALVARVETLKRNCVALIEDCRRDITAAESRTLRVEAALRAILTCRCQGRWVRVKPVLIQDGTSRMQDVECECRHTARAALEGEAGR